MALYASGKTVPNLNGATTVTDSGLVLVHDGEELKKMTISDFRSAMVTDVNAKIEAEVKRAESVEEGITANANAISYNAQLLANEISRAQSAESTNAENIKANAENIKANADSIAEVKSHTATASSDGLMSASDKAKLDGVDTNANNYNLPSATSTVLGGVKIGDGIDVTDDGTISANIPAMDWANITDKPTKLSEFENDLNYATQEYVDNLLASLEVLDSKSY